MPNKSFGKVLGSQKDYVLCWDLLLLEERASLFFHLDFEPLRRVHNKILDKIVPLLPVQQTRQYCLYKKLKWTFYTCPSELNLASAVRALVILAQGREAGQSQRRLQIQTEKTASCDLISGKGQPFPPAKNFMTIR